MLVADYVIEDVKNVSDANVVRLPEAKTMEQQAAYYREEATRILIELIALMHRADKDRFIIQFQISPDCDCKPFLDGPHISKRF